MKHIHAVPSQPALEAAQPHSVSTIIRAERRLLLKRAQRWAHPGDQARERARTARPASPLQVFGGKAPATSRRGGPTARAGPAPHAPGTARLPAALLTPSPELGQHR